MDDATQKLVAEAHGWCPACGGSGMVMEFEPTDCPNLAVHRALEAAQRPPVSPEVIEELRWLCHTGGLNAEGEQDGDLLAEEILARFSVPLRPEVGPVDPRCRMTR